MDCRVGLNVRNCHYRFWLANSTGTKRQRKEGKSCWVTAACRASLRDSRILKEARLYSKDSHDPTLGRESANTSGGDLPKVLHGEDVWWTRDAWEKDLAGRRQRIYVEEIGWAVWRLR